jgi:hypothetical protein
VILDRRIKIIWVMSVLITISLCLFTDFDLYLLAAYTVASIILFGFDLWKNYTEIYSKSDNYKSLHAWNLISNIAQIFFWSYIIMMIFVLGNLKWYHWFLFVDLFIVSTYLNYKFRNKMLVINKK